VVLVHDEIAHGQVRERADGGAAFVFRPPERPAPGSEDLRLGEDDDAQRRDGEAARALPDDHGQTLGPVEPGRQGRFHIVLAEDLAEVVGLLSVGRDQAHPESFFAPPGQLAGQLAEPTRVAADRVRVEREPRGPGGAGYQLQLHARSGADPLVQRRLIGRHLGRHLQEPGLGHHDRRRCRQVIEQAAATRRRRLAGVERQHHQLVQRGL
jgi:hypothetical protein